MGATTSDERARRTEQGYDAIANDYATRTSTRSGEAEEFFLRFLDALESASLVADLGCGPGPDVRRFQELGHVGIGLDRSMRMLRLAAVNGPGIRADLTSLPLATGTIDAVWSYASLLHIEAADLKSTLEEWERVLRPGGLIGVATSLGGDEGWESAPAAKAKVPDMPIDEQRWFVHHTEESVREVMAKRGWQLVEVSVRSSHRDWLQILARTPNRS